MYIVICKIHKLNYSCAVHFILMIYFKEQNLFVKKIRFEEQKKNII